MKRKAPASVEPLIPTDIPIRDLRGQRVILDSDLAAIYGVPTFRFNEAIKRNRQRFPEDFIFQLTRDEFAELNSSQIAMRGTGSRAAPALTSQNAISKPGRGGRRKLPYAFTEHGALQAANILKSDRAAAMSVYVIRAFIQMREALSAKAGILLRLADMDRKLLEHDDALVTLWSRLQPLLTPPTPPKPKPRIGFKP